MNRLRDLRLEKGWNMSEAARHFKLPYTTYVSYEKSERTPSFDMVCKMAEFYDVSVTYLMGTNDVRGSFPKHEDLVPDEDEVGHDELIRLFESAAPWVRDQALSLLRAAESVREAQDGDPKAR